MGHTTDAFNRPYDEAGSVLLGFEPSGIEKWKTPLHSEWHWPGCKGVSTWWDVQDLWVGDLDDVPGQELVVVANDPHEYPGRVSIVDPRNGQLLSTFWHFGQIHEIEVLPRFFDDRRPAILAWGINNKLAGFGEAPQDGEQKFVPWDQVAVVMILDPGRLDGWGPPPVSPSRFSAAAKPALPYAYACVSLPSNHPGRYVPDGAPFRRESNPGIAAGIRKVEYWTGQSEAATAPWFSVAISGSDQDERPISYPALIVDRHLTFRDLGPTPPVVDETEWSGRAYWEHHWRPIVKNGAYVDAQRDGNGRAN